MSTMRVVWLCQPKLLSWTDLANWAYVPFIPSSIHPIKLSIWVKRATTQGIKPDLQDDKRASILGQHLNQLVMPSWRAMWRQTLQPPWGLQSDVIDQRYCWSRDLEKWGALMSQFWHLIKGIWINTTPFYGHQMSFHDYTFNMKMSLPKILVIFSFPLHGISVY